MEDITEGWIRNLDGQFLWHNQDRTETWISAKEFMTRMELQERERKDAESDSANGSRSQ